MTLFVYSMIFSVAGGVAVSFAVSGEHYLAGASAASALFYLPYAIREAARASK